jgi:hypothetical protein
MVIIELGASHADNDIEKSARRMIACREGSHAGGEEIAFLLSDFVTDEVWRWVSLLAKSIKISMQLFVQNPNQGRSLGPSARDYKNKKSEPRDYDHEFTG